MGREGGTSLTNKVFLLNDMIRKIPDKENIERKRREGEGGK
jgi:hypothetical protein